MRNMRFKQTRKLKKENQSTQAESDEPNAEYFHVEHLEEDETEAENPFGNDGQTNDDDIQMHGSDSEHSSRYSVVILDD